MEIIHMANLDHLLTGADFRHNPYTLYERLRVEDPVYWCDAWGCWILTRYDDILSVLLDPKTFSNRGRVTNVIQREFPEQFLEQISPLMSHFAQGLINSDPPDHTRLRRLVQKTFLPKTLERLRPNVEQIVNELIDQIAYSGQTELVRDLAYPLPVIVIAELLGVPPEMRDRFKEWSSVILEFQAVPKPRPETVLKSQTALLEMREYLRGVAAERRKEPREDLISSLVAVEEKGDMLTTEELLSTGVSILVAGHETTTNLVASAIMLLLSFPEQLAKLRAHPTLLTSAVEEVLRFESPLQRLGRTVTEDVEIRGRRIRKGQTVLSFLGAANRDPEQFPKPDEFEIERTPNKHIGFGHGIHFCLGAPLARLEAPIAIQAVLERLSEVRLKTEDLSWHSGVMRGLVSLPLEFTVRREMS